MISKTGNGKPHVYRFIVLIALIIVIIGIGGYKTYTARQSSGQTSAKVSAAVQIAQAKQKSQPAWLLFHSKTCASCIEMQKVFDQLEPEFRDKVYFINIDVDDPSEAKILQEYDIQYIPTTYFLDKQGNRVFNYVGVVSVDDMRKGLGILAKGE